MAGKPEDPTEHLTSLIDQLIAARQHATKCNDTYAKAKTAADTATADLHAAVESLNAYVNQLASGVNE